MPALRNSRHEAFARAIVKGSTGRAAYCAAGYRAKGVVADAAASRLLGNVKVSARIAELKGAAAQASTIEATRVLEELGKLAFANMLDYMRVGPDGDPVLDFSKLARDQAAALVEVTVEHYLDGRGEDARQVRRVRFKLADKRGALVDRGGAADRTAPEQGRRPSEDLGRVQASEPRAGHTLNIGTPLNRPS
jgi:phage terminase small subunit